MALLKKFGESLLGQDIGIEESRVRQAKEAERRGSFQDAKRYQRVARRGYRNAMRNGDFEGAAKAMDWLKKEGHMTMGSGVTQHGVFQGMANNPAGSSAMGGGMNTLERRPARDGASTNLDLRLGLFDMMKNSLSEGKNLQDDWKDAKGLGVTPAGFGNAMDRAQREVGQAPAGSQLNLNRRLGLFNKMESAAAAGQDLNSFWGAAKGLGVTPAGFESGIHRARTVQQSAVNNQSGSTPEPTIPIPPVQGGTQQNTGLFAYKDPNAGNYNKDSPNPYERAAAS